MCLSKECTRIPDRVVSLRKGLNAFAKEAAGIFRGMSEHEIPLL